MTNSPRLEEPPHQAIAQGKLSHLANGFYVAPIDLKQAPIDVVTAVKDAMKGGGHRAAAPVASTNGHHSPFGPHASSTSNPGTEQAAATGSSASHTLPDRLSPGSESPDSKQLPSGATGPLLRKAVPQDAPPAADKAAGPPTNPTGTFSGPSVQQQRAHPRSHSSSANRPAYGNSRRLSQSAFQMPATSYYFPPSYSDLSNPYQGFQQQQFWSAGGILPQAEGASHGMQAPGVAGIHPGYYPQDEGYAQQYPGVLGGMNTYPVYNTSGLPMSPLAQPVSYAQQQYQQPYEQGQYTYPFPMVPMTMPYMGQHYDASSPQHAGHLGPQNALSTGSASGALYYPPVIEQAPYYAGNYYPQGQQYAPNGSVYFNAPYAPEYYGPSFGNGGNGYTGAPSNAFSRLQKGGRGYRQTRNQHHGASFQGHTAALPDSQKRLVVVASGAEADSYVWSSPPGHRRLRSLPGPDTQQRPRGHRRQESSPAEVQTFRPPRKTSQDCFPHSKGRGHYRHFSLPAGVEFTTRLQGVKGGDGRRHRRARSEEAKTPVAAEEPRAAAILEDFKSSRAQQYALKDINGHVSEFCRDQFGSRFIQQKLENATPEEVESIFDEVCASADSALKLMCDVFGNYVVQKFLEHGTPAQRTRLAGAMRGSIKALSLQMYGCRVVQKAIDVLLDPEKVVLVEELKGQIIECVADQNGNHVIQKCIEAIKPTKNIMFILEELAGMRPGSAGAARRTALLPSKVALRAGFVTMARHPYGCRVVQRILEHCDIPSYTKALLEEVHKHALELARDTYGNYVIQHSLQHGDEPQRTDAINRLRGHIVGLAQHKFASNVIEKCLQHGNRKQCTAMVEEMLGDGSGLVGPAKDELLHQMMRDQYGNYVVQKTLEVIAKVPRKLQRRYIIALLRMNHKQAVEFDSLLKFKTKGPGVVCTEAQREELLKRVHSHLIALRKLTYGKHIVGRVEKLLIDTATPTSKMDEAGTNSSAEPSDDEPGAAQGEV